MASSQANDSAQQCFNAIAQALEQRPTRIELLPSFITISTSSSSSSSLLDLSDNTLSIPQKTLLAAYTVAHLQFSSSTSSLTHNTSTPLELDYQIPNLLVCSLILLLVTSEHHTALNFRKRILQNKPHLLIAADELHLIGVILRSPLFKHAKSPAMWSHRKWVVKTFYSGDPEEEEQQLVFDEEVAVILAAAETHPKNYYAWTYARWLFDNYGKQRRTTDAKHMLVEWCMKHPSDVSAWAFLLDFMKCDNNSSAEDDSAIIKQALKFCVDVAPERDAIWLFVIGCVQTLQLNDKERQENIRRVIQESPFLGNVAYEKWFTQLTRKF